MVIILFNIIEPVGWRVGLTRIEDVAIGCGVSIVVGLLFWPRGATAALGRALSDAFVASSAYLADAVDRLTMTSRFVDIEPSQRRVAPRLPPAGRRLSPVLHRARRQGASRSTRSPGSSPDRTASASARTPWGRSGWTRRPTGLPEVEAIAVAEAVLRDSYAETHRWYQEFADLLADRRSDLALPPVPQRDAAPRPTDGLRRGAGPAAPGPRAHRPPDAVGGRAPGEPELHAGTTCWPRRTSSSGVSVTDC